jgi:hypothetical protein
VTSTTASRHLANRVDLNTDIRDTTGLLSQGVDHGSLKLTVDHGSTLKSPKFIKIIAKKIQLLLNCVAIIKPNGFVLFMESRKVMGSIHDVTGFFNRPNPSSLNISLGSTQPIK